MLTLGVQGADAAHARQDAGVASRVVRCGHHRGQARVAKHPQLAQQARAAAALPVAGAPCASPAAPRQRAPFWPGRLLQLGTRPPRPQAFFRRVRCHLDQLYLEGGDAGIGCTPGKRACLARPRTPEEASGHRGACAPALCAGGCEAPPSAACRPQAGDRRHDVYMGVDCFGRGTFGGGGYGCSTALQASASQGVPHSRQHAGETVAGCIAPRPRWGALAEHRAVVCTGLSAALFATAWPFDCAGAGAGAGAAAGDWNERDALFWSLISDAFPVNRALAHSLPLYTNFGAGRGRLYAQQVCTAHTVLAGSPFPAITGERPSPCSFLHPAAAAPPGPHHGICRARSCPKLPGTT